MTFYKVALPTFQAGKVQMWDALAPIVTSDLVTGRVFLIKAPEILPAKSDVRAGVQYGENGTELVGTLSGSGGGYRVIHSPVIR